MTPADFVKQMSKEGITANSDGLLRDFVARGKWKAALNVIPDAISKRETEIDFLKELEIDLIEHIGGPE